MVRNFSIVNGSPSLPARRWRKRTGRPESSRISSAIASSSGESRTSSVPPIARSIARFIATVERGGSEKRKSSTGSSARRLSSIPGPSRPKCWGRKVSARPAALHSSISRSAAGSLISCSVTITRSTSCSRATREMSATEPSRGRPPAPRRRPRRAARGSRPGAGGSRGGWRPGARRRRPRPAGPTTIPVAAPVRRCQKKRSTAREAKLPSRAPTPTAIALAAGQRADRAQRQQAVERERAERRGRDQAGELVEGAVADPAVVVVVEAVQLQHEDPDRAEHHRPEERADVGLRARRGDDAERRRPAPASRRSASRRRSSAPRRRAPLGAGQAQPRRRARSGRRCGAGPAARRRRPCAMRSPAPCASSASPSRSPEALLARVQPAGLFEVGPGRRRVRRPRARLWSAGSRAASCGPRGRSPASSRSVAVA